MQEWIYLGQERPKHPSVNNKVLGSASCYCLVCVCHWCFTLVQRCGKPVHDRNQKSSYEQLVFELQKFSAV